jgi:flagellar biosynthesis/type III secretory pathway M-ring protein FliF/YscJ
VSTTNYEISQTEEKTVSTPGGIVHMTVAVLLPSRIKLPADGPAQIKSLIEQATGFDESRKDTITVSVLPFNVPDIAAETQEMVKEDHYRRILDLARVCMPVVAVVLFWGIGGFLARRRQQKRPVDVAWRLDDPASPNLVPAGGPTLSSTGADGTEPHGLPVLPPSEDLPTPAVGSLPGGITPDARLVALGDLDETARLIELWTQTKSQEGDHPA